MAENGRGAARELLQSSVAGAVTEAVIDRLAVIDVRHNDSDRKTKLRSAAEKKEYLDVAAISADNCRALGKSLHGDGKVKYGSLPSCRGMKEAKL